MKKFLVLCVVVGFAASLAFAQTPSAFNNTDSAFQAPEKKAGEKSKTTRKAKARPKGKQHHSKKAHVTKKEPKKDAQQGQ